MIDVFRLEPILEVGQEILNEDRDVNFSMKVFTDYFAFQNSDCKTYLATTAYNWAIQQEMGYGY